MTSPLPPATRRDRRSSLRRANDPARASRHLTRLALATGGVVLATTLGVATAGGTTALLNAQEPLDGATITAGTMDLRVNGAATAAIGEWHVTPSAPQALPFTVTNVSTVRVDLAGTIAATSADPLSTNATARLTTLAPGATCALGLAGAQGALHGYAAPTLGTIQPGESVTLCLEVGLQSTTPADRSGQSVSFALSLTSTQRAD